MFDQCRGCMSANTNNSFQPLFSDNLADLFHQLTAINISHDDGLSVLICSLCVGHLKSHNAFKQQCLRTDGLFRRKLTKISEEMGTTDADRICTAVTENVPQVASGDSTDVIADDGHLGKLNVHDVGDWDGFVKAKERQSLGIQEANSTKGQDDQTTDEMKSLEAEQVQLHDNVDDGIQTRDNESECDLDDVGDAEKPVQSKNSKTSTKSKKNSRTSRSVVPKKLSKDYDPRKHYTFPFRCPICNRGFRYKERFDGHMREHDGKRAAVCELCGREYSKWSGLLQHVKLSHKNEMKYTCYCGKEFMYESGLITHRMTHTGPRKCICENCGKIFPDSYQLNKHFLVHQTETPFECDECGKKFKSDFHLRAHQFRHKGIRNFTCQTCGKSVATRPELRSHMRVHSAEKSFECNVCGKFFRHKSQVATHMRTHTGDKPYRCPTCGKCFTCLNSLKIHNRIHTGEKPYQCQLCCRTFAQGSVLKTHMKIHQNEKPDGAGS